MGVAAKAAGKMMAMTVQKNMPGHLAAPGKLSEIQELVRVQKMLMKLI